MTDGIEIQIISTSEKFVNPCHKSTVTFKHRDLGQAMIFIRISPAFCLTASQNCTKREGHSDQNKF